MADDTRDRALAEIRALIASATYDRKVNKAQRQLDLIARSLEISRAAGVHDAEVVAMVRNSLDRVLQGVVPPPRRRLGFLLRRGAAIEEPLPATPPVESGPSQIPWAPPEPPAD
jgi:hypothetical protein